MTNVYDEGLRPLTPAEFNVVAEFKRAMEDEVIPVVVKIMSVRADMIRKNEGRRIL